MSHSLKQLHPVHWCSSRFHFILTWISGNWLAYFCEFNIVERMDMNAEVNNAATTLKIGQADRRRETWKKYDRMMHIKWIISKLRATASVIQSTLAKMNRRYSILIGSLKFTPCLFPLTWTDNGGRAGVDLWQCRADCCDIMPEVVCCNIERWN